MRNHTKVFNLHFCIYQVQSRELSLRPLVDHLKLSLALVAAAKDSRIESWTERKWLSELSIVEINRATRGEDIGGVITSVRRGPFLTKAWYTESPLKSAALLLDVCWGWRRESAANRRLLIKGGSSRRCSHDIPSTQTEDRPICSELIIEAIEPCKNRTNQGVLNYYRGQVIKADFFHLLNISFCITVMPTNTQVQRVCAFLGGLAGLIIRLSLQRLCRLFKCGWGLTPWELLAIFLASAH